MTYLNLILAIGFNGLILSIVGVFFERLLVRGGWARGNAWAVVLACLFLGFLMRLVDHERAHLLLWLFAAVLAPIGMNRIDLLTSLTRGRWWWRSN